MNRTKIIQAAIGAFGVAVMLWAAPAQAGQTRGYLGSFGPGGPGSGTFHYLQAVAVDQSTEDVYVYDDGEGGRIYKFNAKGEPLAFSGLAGSNAIESVGEAGGAEEQLAVDDSSGPAQGDIYLADYSKVQIYSSAGTKLGELNGNGTCGVAVGPDGHVYVGTYGSGAITQYAPSANPVTSSDYLFSLNGVGGVCNVVVDSEGDVYANSWSGGVRKYAPSLFNTSGNPVPSEAPFNSTARTLAAAPTGDQLLLDEQTAIAEYSDSGAPTQIGRFANAGAGRLAGSFGVALNATTGKPASSEVYAGDGSQVNIYGPPVAVADATATAASNVERATATLNGTVDPEGLAVSSCEFEYGSEAGSYTSSVACSPTPGSGTSPVPVTGAIGGLTPGSTYHYRLVVLDANGAAFSSDESFQAAPAVDGVASEPATGVTTDAATLNGSLAPDGYDTHYYFQYGATQAYGSLSPALPGTDAGTASGAQAVSVTLGGLSLATSYHYRLVAVNSFGTTYGEDETFTTLAAPPTVEDQPPVVGSVSRTAANIAPTVNPGGLPSTLVVEYVSAAEYRPEAANPYSRGASSPTDSIPAFGKDRAVGPIGIVALMPGTTYHYRLVARNSIGTMFGQDHTFTTAPGTPPVVATGSAGEVTQTSALLTGVVEAQGLQTSYEFEIGTDTTYSGGKLFGNAGQSAGAESVSTTLQFLVPGVTYHYRLVASNEDGTTYGQDMTFTTPGVSTPIAQPPSALLIASPAVVFPTVSTAGKSSGSKKKGKPSTKKKKSSRKKRGKPKRKAATHASSHAEHTVKGRKKS
jgi:hypothetical protein